MTEEQEKQPTPRNAAERVMLIVERLQQFGGAPWLQFCREMLEENELVRLMPKVPLLFRPFEQVLEFIDSGQVKGITDHGGYIAQVLHGMKQPLSDPQRMFSSCHEATGSVNWEALQFVLKFCAEYMGEEEDTSEEIRQILEELSLVRSEIEKAELDEKVREFCLAQIDALERALRVGKLLGGEPIVAAMWGVAQNLSELSQKMQAKIPAKQRKLVKRVAMLAGKLFVGGGVLAKLVWQDDKNEEE